MRRVSPELPIKSNKHTSVRTLPALRRLSRVAWNVSGLGCFYANRLLTPGAHSGAHPTLSGPACCESWTEITTRTAREGGLTPPRGGRSARRRHGHSSCWKLQGGQGGEARAPSGAGSAGWGRRGFSVSGPLGRGRGARRSKAGHGGDRRTVAFKNIKTLHQ